MVNCPGAKVGEDFYGHQQKKLESFVADNSPTFYVVIVCYLSPASMIHLANWVILKNGK